MIGIVIALEKEASPILEQLDVQKQFELSGKKCFKGKLYGKDVCLIISDIGKVNAASAVQSILTRFPEIDRLLNIGVSGAVNSDLKICDICVVEKTLQYDFDITAIDDVPLGYIQNLKQQYLYSDKKMYGGLMAIFNKTITVATADRFSFHEKDAELILSLGGDVRDMELGAIYQVCAMNNIPAISIKSISDTAENNPADEFIINLEKSTNCYKEYISQIMEIVANE